MWFYYATCLLISIIVLLVYLYYNTKSMDSILAILFFAIVMSNWGSLMIASSKTITEALLGKKIYYFGASVVIPIYLLQILSICNIRISRKLKLIINIIVCFSVGIISFIGRGDLYYRNEKLVFKNGVAIIEKDNGILHTLYYAFFIILTLVCVLIVVWVYVKKMNVSIKSINANSKNSNSIT